jgi:predicted SAM-dependent methyltransferase
MQSPTVDATGQANDNAPPAKLVLHVGCGVPGRQNLHPHFHGAEWRELRLDIDPSVNPDIVASMTDMGTVGAESVDAVWSSHNLEHLYRHEVPRALAEFFRVLRPTGFVLLRVPDLQRIAELVAADRLEGEAYVSPSGPIMPLDMIYGHTGSIAAGHVFMAHRTGFSATTLHNLLTRAGFADLRIFRGDGFDLWAVGAKSPGSAQPMP